VISPAGDAGSGMGPGNDKGPMQALMLHLLRMLETRVEAARIAAQSEVRVVRNRVQLKLLAGVAMIVALWAAIVLIAVALPPHLRIPVLSGVVALFAIGAVVAWIVASRDRKQNEPGSLAWFVEGLKLDLEVIARTFERSTAHAAAQPADEPPPEQTPPPPRETQEPPTSTRSPPSDLAA
jgi:uncharacterized membrane protein YqjE